MTWTGEAERDPNDVMTLNLVGANPLKKDYCNIELPGMMDQYYCSEHLPLQIMMSLAYRAIKFMILFTVKST